MSDNDNCRTYDFSVIPAGTRTGGLSWSAKCPASITAILSADPHCKAVIGRIAVRRSPQDTIAVVFPGRWPEYPTAVAWGPPFGRPVLFKHAH